MALLGGVLRAGEPLSDEMLSGGLGPWKKQIFPEGGQLKAAVFGAKAVPTRSPAQESPEVTEEKIAHGKVTPTYIIQNPARPSSQP